MMNKQTGKISKLMLMMIAAAVVLVGYVAFKKRNTIVNEVSSIATTVSETIISEPNYTGYGVQLMATRDITQAKQLMHDFARDGYSAFVLSTELRGRPIYKVRVGPYLYKSEAVAIKDKLKRRYPRNRYVKSSLVIYLP